MSTVYVDALKTTIAKDARTRRVGARSGHQWCHMWCEDLDRLHDLARRIGLHRGWFQNKPGFPHYDLTPSRRVQALAHGAVETSLRAWLFDKGKADSHAAQAQQEICQS
jgi:hypothetical protein